MAPKKQTEEDVIIEKKTSKREYIYAIGRRKEAVARVRLYVSKNDVIWGESALKKGEIFVNKIPIKQYFSGDVAKGLYSEPFRSTNTEGKFVVTISVVGGGKNGQLGAVTLGISRALILHDPKLRPILKKKGFLTRDPRIRERRKVGTGGKARRKKQSPKR